MRGKGVAAGTVPMSKVGSPPPMRGKVNVGTDATIKIRITPAYAGKSGAFPVWIAWS